MRRSTMRHNSMMGGGCGSRSGSNASRGKTQCHQCDLKPPIHLDKTLCIQISPKTSVCISSVENFRNNNGAIKITYILNISSSAVN